jgi:hypothetical protein
MNREYQMNRPKRPQVLECGGHDAAFEGKPASVPPMLVGNPTPVQSGVALRLPPQSITQARWVRGSRFRCVFGDSLKPSTKFPFVVPRLRGRLKAELQTNGASAGYSGSTGGGE